MNAEIEKLAKELKQIDVDSRSAEDYDKKLLRYVALMVLEARIDTLQELRAKPTGFLLQDEIEEMLAALTKQRDALLSKGKI